MEKHAKTGAKQAGIQIHNSKIKICQKIIVEIQMVTQVFGVSQQENQKMHGEIVNQNLKSRLTLVVERELRSAKLTIAKTTEEQRIRQLMDSSADHGRKNINRNTQKLDWFRISVEIQMVTSLLGATSLIQNGHTVSQSKQWM
jgi:hypothetical protein